MVFRFSPGRQPYCSTGVSQNEPVFLRKGFDPASAGSHLKGISDHLEVPL